MCGGQVKEKFHYFLNVFEKSSKVYFIAELHKKGTKPGKSPQYFRSLETWSTNNN